MASRRARLCSSWLWYARAFPSSLPGSQVINASGGMLQIDLLYNVAAIALIGRVLYLTQVRDRHSSDDP
jgi:hypothetical protein